MKVVIFGATGFVGKRVLNEALAQNHQVTILVRNKSAVTIQNENLTVIEGNVMDRNHISAVLKNQDAVIQCLGVLERSAKPTSFMSEVTKTIVGEMERAGVSRLISMSNIGAGNSVGHNPWYFTKIILPYFMKWLKVVIDDKNRMEPVIMSSHLNWTIVRCPNIVDKPAKGNTHITLDGKGLKLSITLSDLAKFLVRQLVDKSFYRQAPSVSN